MVSGVHRRLLALAPGARGLLALAVGCGVLSAVALVVQAGALARIVDGAAFGAGAPSAAFVALLAAVACRAVLAAVTEWSGRRAAERALGELRRRVAAFVLSARVRRVDDARRGELATAAVHGVDALAEYYAKAVPQLVLAAVVPIGLVGVLLWHDPVVAVLLGLTLPVVVVFMVLVGRESASRLAERRLALGVLGTHFLDVVRGLPALRAHGRAAAQAETLAAIGERYRVESVAALRVAFLSALVLELLAMVGVAIAAAVVGVQLASGSLTFSSGLFVLLLAPEVYLPLRLAGQRYHAAEDGAVAAEALFSLLDSATPPVDGRAGADPARRAIVARDVVVEGGAGRPRSLDGLSVRIAPGRLTALIGPSGAGKSTLLSLLAGVRAPDAGELLCGDVPFGGKTWWPRVALLEQRPALLSGPLRDSLTLWRPDADALSLQLALRRAGAVDVVASLPGGLGCVVGPGGRPLAGGQTQRLALAAVLVSRAPLLLLDEPTAHLDPDGAAVAAAGIRAAAAGRTVVVATHDPGLMAVCDDVVELAAGRCVEPVVEGVAA